MTWFRLDDAGAFHAKVLLAGNDGYGALCRAGQWASQHLTDGVIPRAVALTIAPAKVWAKLLAAIPAGHEHGLIEQHGDGWKIHDFLHYNPSAEQVRARRETRKEAGRAGGLAKAEASKVLANASPVASSTVQPVTGYRPTPDPDPDPKIYDDDVAGARARIESLPDDPVDPVSKPVLDALEKSPGLRDVGFATLAIARSLATQAYTMGMPEARLVQVIGEIGAELDLALAAGEPWTLPATAERFRRYIRGGKRKVQTPIAEQSPRHHQDVARMTVPVAESRQVAVRRSVPVGPPQNPPVKLVPAPPRVIGGPRSSDVVNEQPGAERVGS